MLSMRINFPLIHCFMPSKIQGWCSQGSTVFASVCVFGLALSSNFFFLRAAALRRSFWFMLDSFQPIAEVPHSPLHQVECIAKCIPKQNGSTFQKKKEADQFLFSTESEQTKCWTFWTFRTKDIQSEKTSIYVWLIRQLDGDTRSRWLCKRCPCTFSGKAVSIPDCYTMSQQYGSLGS